MPPPPPPRGQPALPAKRTFTDCACLWIFIAFAAGLVWIFMYAQEHGNILKITQGFDWTGEICGVGKGVEDKPYLYWCVKPDTHAVSAAISGKPDLSSGVPAVPKLQLMDGVCVKTCPTLATTTNKCPGLPHFTQEDSPADSDGKETVTYTMKRHLEWQNDVPTVAMMGAYCFPTGNQELLDTIIAKTGGEGVVKQVFSCMQGVISNKWLLIGVAVVAFLVGYLYLLTMFFLVKPFVIISFILVEVGSFTAGACLLLMGLVDLVPGVQSVMDTLNVTSYFQSDFLAALIGQKIDPMIYACVGGALLLFWFIFSIMLCCARKSIGLILTAIKETCSTIMLMPTLLLQPVIQLVLLLVTLTFMFYGLGWVMSLADVHTADPMMAMAAGKGAEIEVTGLKRTLEFDDFQKRLLLVWIFGIFWVKEIVNALGQFAISHAVVQRHTGENSCLPLVKGYSSGVCFHAGSLAFGGFIIGLLGFVSLVLKFVSGQAKASSGDNKVVAIVAGCCACFMECLEGLMRLVNQMVYVDICLMGTSYTRSSWHVFKIFAKNASAISLSVIVATGIKYLGLITIGGLGTFLAYEALSSPEIMLQAIEMGSGVLDPDLQAQLMGASGAALRSSSVVGGTVAAAIISLTIAALFMNIIEMTANSSAYYELWNRDYGGKGDKDYQLLE